MIDFYRLRMHNFGVWHDLDLPLHQQGLVCIRGLNGCGKSTIWRGLHWSMYGKTPEGFKVNELTLNKQASWVSVFFKKNNNKYIITRYRNHHDFGNKVTIKGLYVPHIDEDSLMSDVQQFINHILECDENVFSTTTYFAQRQFDYFHGLTDTGKKEFLEHLGYGSLFQECESITREKYKQTERSLYVIQSELQGLKFGLQKVMDQQKKYQVQHTNQLKTLRNDYNILHKQLQADQTHLEIKQKSIKENSNLIAYQNEIKFELQTLQNQLRNIEQLDTQCPTCLSILDDKHKKLISASIREKITECNSEIIKYKEIVDYYNVSKNETHDLQLNISMTKSKMQQIKIQYNDLKNTTENNDEINDIKQRIYELNQEQEVLERNFNNLKFWIKGFGFQGLRSAVLSQIVYQVCDTTNKYLRYVMSSAYDKFIMEFKSTKLYTAFGERSYNTLSGGEKQVTNLCTGLSMRKVAENYSKSRFNLLVLDEPLDSLDQHYQSRVQTLLGEIQKPSTFIITHDQIDVDFDKILLVEKKNGIAHLRRVS